MRASKSMASSVPMAGARFGRRRPESRLQAMTGLSAGTLGPRLGALPRGGQLPLHPSIARLRACLRPPEFCVLFLSFLALVFGYLCGSIPFGLILTRLAGTANLRTIGSGNIGATNVLRTGRKDLAAATLLLDLGKGAAAVLIVSFIVERLTPGAPWPPPLSSPQRPAPFSGISIRSGSASGAARASQPFSAVFSPSPRRRGSPSSPCGSALRRSRAFPRSPRCSPVPWRRPFCSLRVASVRLSCSRRSLRFSG